MGGLMDYKARFYSPYLNHFIQSDSIVPNVFHSQSLNHYSYVNNSPLNLIDPTGHFPEENWSISFSINYSNSVQFNTPYSQYFPNNNSLLTGSYGNLCGDISLEMIYDSFVTDAPLGYFYGNRPATPYSAVGDVSTWAFQLGQQAAKSFPVGWEVFAYQYSTTYTFDSGFGLIDPPLNPVNTTQYDNLSFVQIKSSMIKKIGQGHIMVMLVTIDLQGNLIKFDPSGGGVYHWVVLTGVSSSGVTINNPFKNRPEKYSWDDYLSSFAYASVELTPPSTPKIRHSKLPIPM